MPTATDMLSTRPTAAARAPNVPRMTQVLALILLAAPSLAIAQDDDKADLPEDIRRFQSLTDPEGLAKAISKKKEKLKPPFEFFRTQVAPFDVLPYAKPGHWITLSLEMRANTNPYDGQLRTSPVMLAEMPHATTFSTAATLPKDADRRLSLQALIPRAMKELPLQLTRPDALRADGETLAPLKMLGPHQMLVPILCPEPSKYAPWMRFAAALPISGDSETLAIDRERYYRFVPQNDPEKPVPLSTNPLTWSTISHVLWHGIDPEQLQRSGQEPALLDWLHWGGQLIVVAAGPESLELDKSFLGPYLPAVPTGSNTSMDAAALAALADEYRPVFGRTEMIESLETQSLKGAPPRHKAVEPITLGPNRSVALSTLDLRPGATPIPLGDAGGHLLGAEWRVGRGRVTVVAFDPMNPSLSAVQWPGGDEFVRRVILRRPLERWNMLGSKSYDFLPGTELSWFRIASRDIGSVGETVPVETGETPLPNKPVASWTDTRSELPVMARRALADASGISIPSSRFVLKVILAYIVALVPLNYLLCRFVFRRRELAWVVAPILSLGCAFAVERAAAFDLGFEKACDEIDVLEIQAGYNHAHLSRFAALYSTGRERFTVGYPDERNALALPLNMQIALRGEDVERSGWQSSPYPALVDFPVQPRSLSMFRAEAFTDLKGIVELVEEPGKPPRIVNKTGLNLRDAVVTYPSGDLSDPSSFVPIGSIPGGGQATIERRLIGDKSAGGAVEGSWLDVEPFLKRLQSYRSDDPAMAGEVRLVAWAEGPHPGQNLEPAVDRHRGFRLVLVHLKYGPPPSPFLPPYVDKPAAVAANPGASPR